MSEMVEAIFVLAVFYGAPIFWLWRKDKEWRKRGEIERLHEQALREHWDWKWEQDCKRENAEWVKWRKEVGFKDSWY